MRLSTIKLSGFKSFVDPTTLHLPTNMTGVVGPNGCGKSNIIDAVRWVMGESSASRLRGDSLTDVIFSGSSARKPVGAATVELIFDNSDGLIAGEYARFSEISVKRMVSRDGQSQYYLNGARCRRRDITDLFLGTGLGPRSYSIIEQGMISQIIEARPEDLRVYLEEAAGISKYKERRKETETRIRHTRENLSRLDDVREEVAKQLEHLRRQARQAEQYQQLKAEQRQKDAELKALEYRRLDGELSTLRDSLSADEVKLQERLAEQRHVEAEIEQCREQQVEAGEALSRVQGEVYKVGAEIARIEQQIQHERELRERLERARSEAENAFSELGEHIRVDEQQLAAVQAELGEAEPELARRTEAERAASEALQAAEQALHDWQQRWDAHARDSAEAARASEVERTRIDYLERQALEAGKRIDALGGERSGLDVAALSSALAETGSRHEAERARLEELTAALDQHKQAGAAIAERQRQRQGELAELRKQQQDARGRLASLEALQHAALGQEQGAGLEWLRQQGLEARQRLGAALAVDAGWETAVETVLGALLEGVLVDDAAALSGTLAGLADGRIALVDAAGGDIAAPAGSLAARVRGPAAVRRLLAGVHGVEGLGEGAALLPSLPAGDSAITREGEWLGQGWARVSRSGEAQRGAIAREREIQQLRADLEALTAREAELQQALDALRRELQDAELAREETQRSLYLAHRGAAELAGQMQSQKGRLESAEARIARIEAELSQLTQATSEADASAREARGRLETALSRMAELEQARQGLEAERRDLQAHRDQAREAARMARQHAHELALSLENKRTRVAALTQALSRMASQHGQLEARRSELAQQLSQGEQPVDRLAGERQACLEQRVLVEKQLSEARSNLDGVEAELRRYEQRRQQLDQEGLALREALARRRLDEQALALREQSLKEGIAAAGLELEPVMAGLPPEAEASAWQDAVATLEAKIRRLEPVNLAAIQEYGEQSQRKEYLDAQHTDLTTALDTLENAIRKIDKETRGRFKDTFDRVNAGVQELYPRLFGGGHAYLELTGEDLLDTGVAIMARPPGKRVSNISLLSGGEKALTAVALVFAIFRLNPAPFCLLDEVDAPLDEANVGRFCAMVLEMSEKVQFLFVTHNKATMEAAHQLAGVTMREPGVSRLVSVDLAEATRLAGAA